MELFYFYEFALNIWILRTGRDGNKARECRIVTNLLWIWSWRGPAAEFDYSAIFFFLNFELRVNLFIRIWGQMDFELMVFCCISKKKKLCILYFKWILLIFPSGPVAFHQGGAAAQPGPRRVEAQEEHGGIAVGTVSRPRHPARAGAPVPAGGRWLGECKRHWFHRVFLLCCIKSHVKRSDTL